MVEICSLDLCEAAAESLRLCQHITEGVEDVADSCCRYERNCN